MRSVEECRKIWRRMENPQCVQDYGLSLTLKEMAQLPEALRTLMELPSQGAKFFHKPTGDMDND